MGTVTAQLQTGAVHQRCEKTVKELRRALGLSPTGADVLLQVDLTQTGSKESNALIKVLRCQHKNTPKDEQSGSELARHDECFRGVMGVGVFNGKKDCAQELMGWFKCYFG